MSINIKPLGDRVVVEPVEREQTTASGIIDDAGKRIEMDVAVGNVVLFAKYAGTEIKLGDKKLLILKESDILAIVEK